MKIILEGMDASGKSTLAKFLCEALNLEFKTAGGPPENDDEALVDCAEQRNSENCVWDRVTSISRRAYQLDIGEQHRLQLGYYAQNLIDQGCVFIWCIGRGDHELKDHDTEEHIEHITSNATVINANYSMIMAGIDCFMFDFKRHTNEEVLEWVKNQLCSKHSMI